MGPEEQWRELLREDRFMLQRAKASGVHFFPPRTAEPGTGDDDWEWVEASGEGTIYAVTIVRPRPPEKLHNVVLVDLAEGPRLMSRVIGDRPVTIGMKVTALIDRDGDEPLLLFQPA